MEICLRYQDEWDRLLGESRELITIAMEIAEILFQLDMMKSKSIVQQQMYSDNKEKMAKRHTNYKELSSILYSQLVHFKGNKYEMKYRKGQWKENAIIFIIANSFNYKKMPLYLKPGDIFEEESLNEFNKEIEEYLDTQTFEKYTKYMKLGFIYYKEEEYLNELIVPC